MVTRSSDENTIRVNIRVPRPLHAYYKQKSEKMGVPMAILMMMDMLEKSKREK